MVISNAAIVTARNSSKRLPNKMMLEIKKGICAIGIVLERAKKTNFQVILATSKDENDDSFIEIAKKHNVEIFRGSSLNKIKRWYDCFKSYEIDNALLIDGDDLSYDYEIGQRALLEIKKEKVDVIACPKEIVPGFFTYAITKSAIKKLHDIVPFESTDISFNSVIVEFVIVVVSKLVGTRNNNIENPMITVTPIPTMERKMSFAPFHLLR